MIAGMSEAEDVLAGDVRACLILPYDVVAQSAAPDTTLLGFLQSSYEAAADFGAWDRAALERAEIPRSPEQPRHG